MFYYEKILIVDDEIGLLELLKLTLEKEHYCNITCATTAMEALNLIKEQTFDIILLDVMLPDFSGFDLCPKIRELTITPIIFLSACNSDFDKLTGLTLGGDDYITKPFNPLEVVVRVKAMLRRQQLYANNLSSNERSPSPLFDYGYFSLNPTTATLLVKNEQVECTAKEFELLLFFCQNPNRVFTPTQIYESVWDELGIGDDKTVTMHISKIRKKIQDDPKAPNIIITLRGIGYKFIPPAFNN